MKMPAGDALAEPHVHFFHLLLVRETVECVARGEVETLTVPFLPGEEYEALVGAHVTAENLHRCMIGSTARRDVEAHTSGCDSAKWVVGELLVFAPIAGKQLHWNVRLEYARWNVQAQSTHSDGAIGLEGEQLVLASVAVEQLQLDMR